VELRPDFEQIRAARHETRSAERLRAHFEVESKLAKELSGSTQEQRSALYSNVYRQLFENVPDHPQHRGDRTVRLERIQTQKAMLLKTLTPNSTYVEIGCGDAVLTKAVAPHVRSAIGVDVTEFLVTDEAPPSFRFVKSDGVTLDIPTDTADLVYSNQLMEHLHIDDAVAQLREIHRVLKPGGRYVCSTPNRLTGPHDISVYFGREASGFHLREYDHRMLAKIFRSVGFSVVKAAIHLKGSVFNLPVPFVGTVEAALEALPKSLSTKMLLHPSVSNVLGVNLIGIK
jgi:ubiquinone/menaquinone biosynthesis C-methylase UbiE